MNTELNDGQAREDVDQKPSAELDFAFVLASSVHDMKNSLGMLLTSLEDMIEETPAESEKQKKRFSTLQYEANRINTELIQLLSLYRFQNKTMPIHIDDCFVMDTIEDQVARNDMLVKTQGIELIVECDPDLSWFYDNDLIGNVIHNVMVNSTRYAKGKILISAQVGVDGLVITIEDDGQGFPLGMIEAASLDSEAHSNGNSTQLGLFFAAKIAELHQQDSRHGTITLANGGRWGGGVFKIFLP